MSPSTYAAIARKVSTFTGREITAQRVKEVDEGGWQRSHPIDAIILSILDRYKSARTNKKNKKK